MLEKILKIPFDNNYFLESRKTVWDYLNRKNLKINIYLTGVTIVCLSLNLTFERGAKFPIGTVLCGGYLSYMCMFWIGRFERKVRYFKRAKNEALRHQAEAMDGTYVFSDDSFEYSDNEKSFRLNWSLFKPFVIFKDSILLILGDSAVVGFTISRSEIGDKEFLELCDILTQKTCKS